MESLLGNNIRKPDISFYENGRIDITSRLAKELGLEDGDVIDILHSGKEYYLYIRLKNASSIGKYSAQCTPTKNKSNHFRCYCKQLANMILCECGNAQLARLHAGETIEISNVGNAISIITHNNISNNDKRY